MTLDERSEEVTTKCATTNKTGYMGLANMRSLVQRDGHQAPLHPL